ncbi:HET-domain-containing protein, partial [Lophium mytilinum]
MRDWIHECDQGHSQCKKPDSTFLPTRLLDVGVASSKQTRLVLSTDIEAVEASYVALSHCWGPSKPLVTTSSNISQFQVDIPASSLPQTFEDAIEVTRLLGKRHLWIDSLCIIQDVPADWLRESATMSSVYSNADITISASRASSAVDGFLSLRHEIYVTKQEPNRSGQETKLYLVLRDYYENSTSRAADSHPEPLSRRAWVIQERYLSRRKILFGSAQTFWECNGMAKSEDTQLEMRSNLAEPPRSLPWYDIVESFTDCAITYESDTLPAISGVAKTVAQTSGLTYCAGIW